jgi:hypothetical protein
VGLPLLRLTRSFETIIKCLLNCSAHIEAVFRHEYRPAKGIGRENRTYFDGAVAGTERSSIG